MSKRFRPKSLDNFFVINIQFKDGTDAKKATADLEAAVKKSANLPPSARVQYTVPYFGPTGDFTRPIDVAISFYPSNSTSATAITTAKAEQAAKWLNEQKVPNAQNFFVSNPFEKAINPVTGQAVVVQHNF